MAKPIATFIVSACVGLGVIGCGPPVPPGQVNAVLPRDLPIYREEPEVCDKADTLVLAQCVQRQEYAKAVRGDWERHWYLTSWRVVRVERGRWPDASVDFIFHESWPTPESGILLRAPLPVYYRGALLAFCVDTSQDKPAIVAQEQRSRIPPHGKLRRPAPDFYDPGKNSVYEQVIAAANRYIGDPRSTIGPRWVVEEYDDFYVVEIGNASVSEAVTVDKDDHEVRPVRSAYE